MKISIIAILVFVSGYGVLAYMTNNTKEKATDLEIQRPNNSNKDISLKTKKITNKPTIEEERKKKQAAAHSYLGYYLLYTVAIPKYCEEKGFDMSSFKKAIEVSNSKLFTLAKNTLYFDQVSVNESFSKNRLVLMKGASYTIKESAKYNKMTEKETCGFYSQGYDYLSKYLDFSKNRPSEYKILTKKLNWRKKQ